MQLVQLIYASMVSQPLHDNDYTELLLNAQKNNTRDGITGVLLASNNYFMQCIEGDAYHINLLYRKIVEDKRHYNVTLIGYHLLANRYFSDWSMAMVTPPNSEQFIKASLKDRAYDPFKFNSADSLTLLLQIKHHVGSKLIAIRA